MPLAGPYAAVWSRHYCGRGSLSRRRIPPRGVDAARADRRHAVTNRRNTDVILSISSLAKLYPAISPDRPGKSFGRGAEEGGGESEAPEVTDADTASVPKEQHYRASVAAPEIPA